MFYSVEWDYGIVELALLSPFYHERQNYKLFDTLTAINTLHRRQTQWRDSLLTSAIKIAINKRL